MKKKYSEWLKVDLHIHTDFSKKTKEGDYKGTFSIDTLKTKLKYNEVQIFSLTDHNIINVDAYKEYYSKYDEENDPLLLVGVELDIELEREDGNRRYHTLLVFREPSTEKLELISNSLEKKYLDKKISDLKLRVLTIRDIVEIFGDEDFFFIPHAHRGDTGIVKAYKHEIHEAQKMILLMPSAMEKVKEEAIHIYNQGFDNLLNESFKSKKDLAYIDFSDNHFIEKYPCIHMGDKGDHEFYYVKGSKNYETIRLAFIDPESRIISSDDYSNLRKETYFIDSVHIEKDLLLEDGQISFSPHLNVMIGGRSSGKSLLLTLLGDKIDGISLDQKEKNKYKIDYESKKIKTLRDADFIEKTNINKDEVLFLSQGKIVKYFEEKELKDLAEESGKGNEYNDTKRVFSEHKKALENVVEDFINGYNSVFEVKDYYRNILHNSTIEKILSKEFILKINEEKLKDKFEVSEEFTEIQTLLNDLSENIKKLNKYKILEITEGESKIINDFIGLVDMKILIVEKKIRSKLNAKNFIESVSFIINEKNKLLNINSQEKEAALRQRSKIIKNIEKYFNELNKFKSKCANLEDYNYGLNKSVKINTDVSLVLEVEKNNNIKELILDGINKSEKEKGFYYNLLKLVSGQKSVKNYNDNLTESLKKKTNVQLSTIFNEIDDPKDYLEYSDGATSKNNSPGYNSEKYLDIILNNPNTKLILIDQPEDNLGNKFIADSLVSLIRKMKFKKQIFLVTHNPSIVVYGDAECIVLAENNNNKISYRQIVLEDKNAQKEICSILDGGEYIFEKRFQKYNIERIKKEKK